VHEAISVVSDHLYTYDNVEAVSHYCKFWVLESCSLEFCSCE